MDYLSFESRDEDMPALMLLAASLRQCTPKSRLHLPSRDMPVAAAAWFRTQSNVVLHEDLWAEDVFWNIKPFLLERMLEKGFARVTWLDADIVVTSDPDHLFDVSEEVMVVAEEGFRSREFGTSQRTRAIGHPIGRELGYTVNSCVVSVTPLHGELLGSWKSLLRSDLYNSSVPILLGDQDILGGLLGAAAFSNIAVRRIRSGRTIAHDMLQGDFGFLQRIAAARRGEPVFAHSQGRKTWRMARHKSEYKRYTSQLAVHRQAAKAFADLIPKESADWISDDTPLAKFMMRLFPKSASMRGLPVGLVGSALNVAYRFRNAFRVKAH